MPIPRLACAAAALAAVLLASQAAHALGPDYVPAWEPKEWVRGGANLLGHEGADRILAFDHYGRAGIAYVSTDTHLYYCERLAGIGWNRLPFGDTLTYTCPSLAYDRYERPGMSVRATIESYHDSVWYTHVGASGWGGSTVGPGGSQTALAYDLYGRPAVVWRDEFLGDHGVRYAMDTDNDGDWTDETVETIYGDAACAWPSLTFDPLNRPMVAFFDHDASGLWFAMHDERFGWVNRFLDPYALGHPSLAVNPVTGHPAIAYGSAAHIRYVEWDGKKWNPTTLASPWGNPTLYPSLAFDPADGHPAIAFYEGTTGGMTLDWEAQMLRFAWFDGETWQMQTVDYEGDVGLCPSLAFNEYGNGWPAIAYFDINGNLWYIEDPPVVPEPATLALVAAGAAAALAARRREARPGSDQDVIEKEN